MRTYKTEQISFYETENMYVLFGSHSKHEEVKVLKSLLKLVFVVQTNDYVFTNIY